MIEDLNSERDDGVDDRRRVLLGVTGGIAAYKACDLVRDLHHSGCRVQVIMTDAATKFVTPLTFAALSGHPVETDLFREDTAHRIDHIELGRWAEIMVIAPATMDFIGKIAHGLAEDLLSNVVLALPKDTPLVFAPAMNTRMWEHPLFRDNLSRVEGLNERGYRVEVIDPVSKELACGEQGTGALVPVTQVLARVHERLGMTRPAGSK